MSATSLRTRLCALLNEPNPVSLTLAAALGLAGVGLYARNLAAGDGIGQAWFVAFLTAYAVGVGGLLSRWREG
jgi:hypothetical protein